MGSPIHHIEDLDASLDYAPRWARDQNLLPAKRLARTRQIGSARRGFSGDRAMIELQRQLALNPDQIPEPPFEGARNLWPIALRLCAVVAFAALIAWGVVSLPSARKPVNETAQADVAPAPIAANRAKLVPVHSASVVPALVPDAPAKTEVPLPAAVLPVPAPQSASSPAPTPASSDAVTLQLDGDEIATLVKRGKGFLTDGDLASARLLLRRAAEGGSAEAALALGATFDPLVIQRLGAVGAEPDIVRARKWYQKAAELGSTAASQQLAKLTQAGQ
jgi:hypothetical protein